MPSYIGFLRKDADSDYGVDFPDFPGCITAGTSLDEARRMAAEALSFHIAGMIEDGDAVPEPSSLDAVMALPDAEGAVAVLIDGPAPANRVVRVNITLEEPLLHRIDEASRNRSRFLAVAAMEKLARETPGEPFAGWGEVLAVVDRSSGERIAAEVVEKVSIARDRAKPARERPRPDVRRTV